MEGLLVHELLGNFNVVSWYSTTKLLFCIDLRRWYCITPQNTR